MKDKNSEIQALAATALAIYSKCISSDKGFDKNAFQKEMYDYVIGKPEDLKTLFYSLNLNPKTAKESFTKEIDSKISQLASELEILFNNNKNIDAKPRTSSSKIKEGFKHFIREIFKIVILFCFKVKNLVDTEEWKYKKQDILIGTTTCTSISAYILSRLAKEDHKNIHEHASKIAIEFDKALEKASKDAFNQILSEDPNLNKTGQQYLKRHYSELSDTFKLRLQESRDKAAALKNYPR